MALMDHTDLKNWARDNHDRFNGMLNQYLLGNRTLEDSLIAIVEKLHPLRDTSGILQEIKARREEVREDDQLDGWDSWLDELEHMVLGLEASDPPPLVPSLPLEKTPTTNPFNFMDLLENATDLHKGNPLYGSLHGRYYPRVSKEAGVRVVEHYGLEGDPRKSIGMALPVRKHEDEEYVLVPPQTTVVLNTVERMRLKPSVIVVLGSHPTYQAIGLETQGGTFDYAGEKMAAVEVRMTNPKSTPARVYLGHGVCELRFIQQDR